MSYPAAIYAKNIESWLTRATYKETKEGKNWYTKASWSCRLEAQHAGIDFLQYCAIVAVLSPNLRWERNIRAANKTIRGELSEAYETNREKARQILRGAKPHDIVSGDKVSAFYLLLLDPKHPDALCIDSIAIGVAVTTKDPATLTNKSMSGVFGRPKQLAAIKKAYRQVAAKHGYTPSQLQAIVWVTWRNERDRK